MDSGLNLVERLLWGKLLKTRNLLFDLYDSPNKKIREPPTKLGGQIKLVNFEPESIVPNIVGRLFRHLGRPLLHVCLD